VQLGAVGCSWVQLKNRDSTHLAHFWVGSNCFRTLFKVDRGQGERFFHGPGGFHLRTWNQVTIRIQGDRRLCVAEYAADGQDRDIAVERDGGGGVAQVVEADFWQVGPPQDFLEFPQ